MIDVVRRYRYVVADKDRNGNWRVYLRRPGMPKVRLRETPGTDAFDAEYRAALISKPKVRKTVARPEKGSLHALCAEYYGSADFKRMDRRSQHVRRLILDRLCEAHGTKPAARMEPRHILKLRDERADAPEAANSLVKALRAAFKHGAAADLVAGNVALQVPYLERTGDGIHTWTPEEVEQYEAAHPIGSKARLALALLLYTGQRRSDVVKLGRQHLRDGVLTFTQFKNRNRKPVQLALPIIPALQEIIDATSSTELAFLISEYGRPYTPESFGNRFRKWCNAAGLPHCSAHGLRKAAATRLAELGCSAHEIMAVTGHKTLKEVDRYTRQAAQRLMAKAALDRVAAATQKVPLSADPSEWDETDIQPFDEKGQKTWMVPRAGIEPATLRFSVACSTN